MIVDGFANPQNYVVRLDGVDNINNYYQNNRKDCSLVHSANCSYSDNTS